MVDLLLSFGGQLNKGLAPVGKKLKALSSSPSKLYPTATKGIDTEVERERSYARHFHVAEGAIPEGRIELHVLI